MATDFIMPRLADTQVSHYFQYQPQPQPQAQAQPQSRAYAHAHAQLPDHAPRRPSQGYQSQGYQSQGYRSQQVSPLSTSNNTSNNSSPTSPKPYQGQRSRPLYMPAVLRPNEHPSKMLYNKDEGEPQTPGQDDDRPASSANSFITLPGLGAWNRLSRRSTCDSDNSMESEWNLDLFPKPTAPPTRQHWKVCLKTPSLSHT
jgi:hypothetical protein